MGETLMATDEQILAWFGGNPHGLTFYKALVDLAHIWDDLVDRDKEVTAEQVNRAFRIALFDLPSNPLYARNLGQILPFWLAIVSAYETANLFESEGQRKGLEISHTLRYAAGHMIAYVMLATAGPAAAQFMPQMWKTIVAEDFADYEKEHLK